MFFLTATLRGLLHKQPVAALVTMPKGKQQEKTETVTIRFQGESSYTAFRNFLFRAAYPKADKEILSTPSLLIERDSDEKGRGKIHVEAEAQQVICELPGITAKLVSVRRVLGIIYNSRDGSSTVFWREPKKIWGSASPRTYAMLLSCRANIQPISSGPMTRSVLLQRN
jgi:hypothetical protein